MASSSTVHICNIHTDWEAEYWRMIPSWRGSVNGSVVLVTSVLYTLLSDSWRLCLVPVPCPGGQIQIESCCLWDQGPGTEKLQGLFNSNCSSGAAQWPADQTVVALSTFLVWVCVTVWMCVTMWMWSGHYCSEKFKSLNVFILGEWNLSSLMYD